MSEPFQFGDVVVCVDRDEGMITPISQAWVRLGAVYRIVCCEIGDNELTGEELWCVTLDGDPENIIDPDGAYPAAWFRKIDDDVTDEFREALRQLPVKTPEPVA